MNLRLGIYDIFSRIVPGCVYLLAFLEFAQVLRWPEMNWTPLLDLKPLPLLGLTILAYVVGTAMDPLGTAWHRLFNPGLGTRIFAEFKEEHKNQWELDFDHNDWPVLRAYIYIHNLNAADEIDRHNALYMMLRNVSLGFVFLAVSQIMQFVVTRNWLFLVLVAALSFLSYQLAIQARGMRRWFYRSIYETIIAYSLKVEELVKPADSSTSAKKGRVKR